MNKSVISPYQKSIIDMLKSGGYIVHNEGSKLEAFYVKGDMKIKVRFISMEILFKNGILKYMNDKEYKMILS